MGKQLLLLRHAKSSWKGDDVSDRERGLNNRGRRNAPVMGRALASLVAPQPIHVSPARRAQLTLGGLQDGWPEMQREQHISAEELYTFSMHDLCDYLVGGGFNESSLFLLGHNPALTELTNYLCGEAVLTNLPTAGFVQLALDIDDWSLLEPACATLTRHLFPRELQNV